MRFKAVIIYDPACGKAIRRHELFADGVADSLLRNVKEIPKNAWNSNGMVWNLAFFPIPMPFISARIGRQRVDGHLQFRIERPFALKML